MQADQSTQQSSRVSKEGGPGGRRIPGLMHLFSMGRPMAAAVPLREDQELELGREAAALGEVQDPRMSRHHACVRFDGRRFWVADLGSRNGTYVDGEPVPAGTPREAQRVIQIGNSLFVPSPDVRPLQEHGVELLDGFVRGPAVRERLGEVERAAQLGFLLHIRGESGTGKEGLARAFHNHGRRTGHFVAVNCAAIPQSIAESLLFGAKRGAYSGAEADAPGYLQSADGGTLFLDEVAELDQMIQAKLLRVIEEKEVLPLGAPRPRKVDFHLCSASNRDLRALVASGRLREDLYFRIGRPEVTLPPLRERPEEIPLLLEREVRQQAPDLELHISLVEACLLRPWPGNVRELLVAVRSALQAALMQGAHRVEARHLSPDAGLVFGPGAHPAPPLPGVAPPAGAPSHAKPLDGDERARIEEALRQQGGNVAATARALGMHRTQLRRLLKRHGILSPGSSAQAEPEDEDE